MPYCNFTTPLQTVIVQQGEKEEVSIVQPEQASERRLFLLAQGSCVLVS